MGSKRYKFSRYKMYTEIEKFLKSRDLKVGKCLLIGDTLKGAGSNTAITDMLPKECSILVPDYPEVDIQSMPYEDNSFDYVQLADDKRTSKLNTINILGNRWRASTRKMMQYKLIGPWQVRLVDENGGLMHEISFEVVE